MVVFHIMNISNILQSSAERFGPKSALIFKDQSVSFSELKTRVFGLSAGLSVAGVRKASKVAIYLPNCPEYAYSYLSLFYLGATIVPLDYMLKTDELVSCLSHSETEWLFILIVVIY